jgi:hypothetical protein
MSASETASPATQPCQVHKSHYPKPLRIVKHHIQPLGMGGADVEGNWEWTCDTGHYSIHIKLAELVFQGNFTPGGTTEERNIARKGYTAWVAAGKPGNPHAAYALQPGEGGHD